MLGQQSVRVIGSRNCTFSPENGHRSQTIMSMEKLMVPSDSAHLNYGKLSLKKLKHLI